MKPLRLIPGLLRTVIFVFAPLSLLAQPSSSSTPPDSQLPVAARADALFYDAVKAKMKGDNREAERLFLQFSSLKPQEPAGYYELSQLAIRQNQPEKAISYIQKTVALDSSNKWYQEQYANVLAFRNEHEKGAEVFARLAKKEQHNEEYLLKSALLYQRAGKSKQALDEIDQLLAKNPGDEELLMQKQQIFLKMNDLNAAVSIARQLISEHPRDPRYYALLADLYDNNKEEAKAAEIYTQAQKLFPDDPTVQLALAGHYRKSKDNKKYDEYVRKAITNKDLDAESQMALLLPYLQELAADSVRRGEGVVLAQQLATQHANDGQVQAFYGDILTINNQRQQASVQYKKAVAIDPSRFNTWQQLLFSMTNPGDADSLIAYSNKALRLFPNQAVVHYLNGVGHLNRKETKPAINAINRGIDLQPEENADMLSQMYTTLGDAYNSIKQYKESDSAYEKALQFDPENATVLNNYAYYLSVRGVRLNDAERMSKKSLDVRPGEATFLDTYGWILYKNGKFAQAKDYIQKAIDANPQEADGTLWDHLGDVLYKLKSTDKAVESWKTAKEKGADNPNLEKKIQDRKLYE